jgi:hypothetical protein
MIAADDGPRGPQRPGGREMADKQIKPKAPEKTEPAAGARDADEAKRDTLRVRKTLRARKSMRVRKTG